MKAFPQRKPNRLAGYDYSQNGAYFITLCVKGRHEILWDPVGARTTRPSLSEIGLVVETAIKNIPNIYETVFLENYTVMPNHIHMILRIDDQNGRALRAPTISTVINQVKGYATKQIRYSIWQKLFHDHIIRNENEYHRIAEYIQNNPLNWEQDCFYTAK